MPALEAAAIAKVLEILAGAAGMTKEGLELTNALRKHAKELSPILVKVLKDSRASNDQIEKINEAYHAVHTARPFIVRIVKHKLIIRVQVLALVAAGVAFSIVFGNYQLEQISEYFGDRFPRFHVPTALLVGIMFAGLYFGSKWFLRISDLRSAALRSKISKTSSDSPSFRDSRALRKRKSKK